MALQESQKAPVFNLPNQDSQPIQLSDFSQKWLLVYFYPKDDTPGCTKEACAMQEHLKQFNKMNFEVVGISPDSVKSHKKFADKYKLTFNLLADEDKKTAQAYGVWGKKKFMGREYMGIHRSSFLVDPKGRIAQIYQKVRPDAHAREVLGDVINFQQ